MLRAAHQDPWTQHWLARIKLAQGDPVAAQSLLDQVPLDFSPAGEIWGIRFEAALYLRDYDAANRVIAATPAEWADDFGGHAGWLRDRLRVRAVISRRRWRRLQPRERRLDARWGDNPRMTRLLRGSGGN